VEEIMAEDKKGFILYADQKELFDQLPNDKAGELIKHIFSYVNDEKPKETDLLIKLAFTPIKQQFKRDLQKWEKTRGQRSSAGKASAEARRLKKTNEIQRDSTGVNEIQRASTNPTVTVNDNVTVKVNVNDILLEKETKGLFTDWLNYRKEIKKPLKHTSQIALAKKINKEGFDKSKVVITTSIENGWQGLFWDKQQTKETPGELIDGFINPTNGKVNMTQFMKKIGG
jgi:hypothetical protein